MAAFSTFHEVALRTATGVAETVVFVWTLGVLAFGFLVTVGFFFER
jgi:hypothetical protein